MVFIQLVLSLSLSHPFNLILTCLSSIDDPVPQLVLKVVELGVISSAMLYGIVATLALTYIPLFLKTSHMISRCMRNFLLAYVTFMVTASTVNTVRATADSGAGLAGDSS